MGWGAQTRSVTGCAMHEGCLPPKASSNLSLYSRPLPLEADRNRSLGITKYFLGCKVPQTAEKCLCELRKPLNSLQQNFSCARMEHHGDPGTAQDAWASVSGLLSAA